MYGVVDRSEEWEEMGPFISGEIISRQRDNDVTSPSYVPYIPLQMTRISSGSFTTVQSNNQINSRGWMTENEEIKKARDLILCLGDKYYMYFEILMEHDYASSYQTARTVEKRNYNGNWGFNKRYIEETSVGSFPVNMNINGDTFSSIGNIKIRKKLLVQDFWNLRTQTRETLALEIPKGIFEPIPLLFKINEAQDWPGEVSEF